MSWSSTGCSFVKELNKEITCTCNHLTNFAILMQVAGNNEVSWFGTLLVTNIGKSLFAFLVICSSLYDEANRIKPLRNIARAFTVSVISEI